MLKRVSLLAVIVFALFAETVFITPSDDMYTDVEHPGAHPPSELWTANFDPSGQYQRIMMRFDLEEYTGMNISNAILNLNRFFGCPSGGITQTEFFAINEDWTEDSWPGDVHIDFLSTPFAEYGFAANGWHEIDFTSIVNDWICGEIENFGFVIKSRPGSKWSKFYSKEAAEAQMPKLEITISDGVYEKENSNPEIIAIQAYPNPFNSSCNFNKFVDLLEVFDVNGNKVDEARDTNKWNAANTQSAGIYLLRITDNGKKYDKKVMYVK
ncbi:MAG: DNRLRE domain-containing protein [Candidatus Zixiibacteriota bacterium]